MPSKQSAIPRWSPWSRNVGEAIAEKCEGATRFAATQRDITQVLQQAAHAAAQPLLSQQIEAFLVPASSKVVVLARPRHVAEDIQHLRGAPAVAYRPPQGERMFQPSLEFLICPGSAEEGKHVDRAGGEHRGSPLVVHI